MGKLRVPSQRCPRIQDCVRPKRQMGTFLRSAQCSGKQHECRADAAVDQAHRASASRALQRIAAVDDVDRRRYQQSCQAADEPLAMRAVNAQELVAPSWPASLASAIRQKTPADSRGGQHRAGRRTRSSAQSSGPGWCRGRTWSLFFVRWPIFNKDLIYSLFALFIFSC